MGVCSLFAVFGAWRVETETRRSYALMLRERLKRRDLSHLNSELVELARRDPLTGLANRRAYEIAEAASWRSAERAGIAVGLVIIDIDHFKSFNDFYGHPAGDACLQAVARCLAEQVRGTADVVARVGGEEFAILLPDLTVDTAGDIAERVRHAVATLELPHLGCGPGRTVTVSCGACSLVPEPGTTPKDLFAAADAALYAAKQAGRNRVCLAEQLVDIPRYGGAAQAASLDQR
jgi:diguanylate cyclase (GGDEF)-like protein